MNNDMDGAATGTYTDPIVVRLYLQLVREGNGSGGVDAQVVSDLMVYLDQVFNEHEIYFDYCLVDVDCEDCWLTGIDGRNAIKDLWVTNSLDDGINCYILPQLSALVGEAEDVGSKNCMSRAWGPDAAHEIGHCLGLLHTHQGSACPPTIDSEYSPYYDSGSNYTDGDNCTESGDFVCNTPADPRCYSLVTNCTFSNPTPFMDYVGHPFIDPGHVLPMNLMSYWSCRSAFTEGQSRRMRDVLADDMALGAVVQPFSHIRSVSGIETWTTPRYFNHDLLVDGYLTIQTEIGFTPGHGIILEGALSVGGGMLTLAPYENTCPTPGGDQWTGIRVVRSPSSTPALIISDESVIEHADKAIHFSGSGNQFVVVSDTEFRNNKISFECIRTLAGPATFTNCDFVIDDEYALNSFFPQVIANHAPPLWFRGCTFSFNQELPATITRHAISTYNGHVLITGFGSRRGRFVNWTQGVRAFQNDGSKLTLVRRSNFSDNEQGIYNFGFQRMSAYENIFDMSNEAISDEAWGIISEQARGIDFHGNDFSSVSSSIYSIGIHSNNTGSENIVIGQNQFSDLDIGVEVFSAGNQSGGMKFLCNGHTANRLYDFKTEFGIGPSHGMPGSPVGNTFTRASNDIDDRDFRAVNLPGDYDVTYYYKTADLAHFPIYVSSMIDRIQTGGGACDHFNLFQDPVDSVSLASYISFNTTLETAIGDKEYELEDPYLTNDEARDLRAEWHYLRLQHDANAANAVVYTLTRDSIDHNDVRLALALKDEFRSAVAAAFTYLQEGDTSSFFYELEGVSAGMTLDPDESQDLDELLWLQSMLHRAYAVGRLEDDLTPSELDTVEIIANEGIGLAGIQARAILCYFYDQCGLIEATRSSGPLDIVDAGLKTVLKDEVGASNDEVMHDVFGSGANLVMAILSTDGRVIMRRIVNASELRFGIEEGDAVPSGLYFLVLQTENGERVVRKVIR